MDLERKLDNFIKAWSHKGDEVADKATYWNSLLNILGIPQDQLDSGDYITYEKPLNWKESKFHGKIDGYIPKTRVLIEQKSIGVDLSKPERRPNGGDNKPITPLEQAKRYDDFLPQSEKAKFFVLSNFAEIWIYDRRTDLDAKPIKLRLSDLKKQLHVLDFMVKTDTKNLPLEKEKEVSLAAGELVSKMYNELVNIFKQYKDIDSKEAQRSINVLCVRLVFCLYAEDAGLFNEKEEFYNYLEPIAPNRIGIALRKLFEVLDTKEEDRTKRDPFFNNDNPELARFPYVNGGMFHDQSIIVPPFTPELKDILLNKASRGFDWSDISPTIFGAVFESTLNPETRRQGGMHYTSVENIHKVIDPLFLDDLKAELQKIKDTYVQPKTLAKHAKAFQEKLANLTFLDPACGSGNFLTETYLSLRKLENEAIRIETRGESLLETGSTADKYIHVSIQHFFGIEINDFAVSVAKTALWIAEDQMMKETQNLIYGANWDFLPLKTYTHIHEGNALRMDWDKTINNDPTKPNIKVNYIISNPPFVSNSARAEKKKGSAFRSMSESQKEDRKTLFGSAGNVLDYVACWFAKAAEYMKNTEVEAAFVSTNSIVQGQQVIALWKPLFDKGIKINFAYHSFKWSSEASTSGLVYVVIIGFSYINRTNKIIYNAEGRIISNNIDNINGYLEDAPNIFLKKRRKPLNTSLIMKSGGKPTDGGHLILSAKEAKALFDKYEKLRPYIHRFMMGNDFINGKKRYCLWLKDASPLILRSFPEVVDRINKVKEFRLHSTKKATKRKAATPYMFDEIKNCNSDYVAIPVVSSGNRKYIPIGYLNKNVIAGDKLFEVEGATLYDFGILTSIVHMAWVRQTCSWYGPSYSYSSTIVYNNFPWPTPTQAQRAKIEQTAQAILDTRANYPDSSLADLYDPLTMKSDLLKAHQVNDRAVMQAYGMKSTMSESEIVAQLFKMYEKLTQKS